MIRRRTPIERSPLRQTPKARRVRSLRSECDGLVRELVLARDHHKCVRCGKTEKLQAAHILPKGHYPRLRYELDNILSLDVGCHLYFAHKDPVGFTRWLEEKYPGRIDQLRVMAASAGRLDLKELRIALTLEVAQL